jgi:lipopolysaccharide export system ATP-binding protein
MPLLEVEALVKYYGSRAVVDGVSFDVEPGEIVGLLGPNGAGKTTSFRMATGQVAPNEGRVTFNGEDVTALPMYQRARRGMGYLSQEPSVFRRLSVEKNLLAILEALPQSRSLKRKLTRAERVERTNAALTRFKLDHVRKNVAGRCSGGEKRRLEIARCLVCEPLLILLDEPFAAVDPITTEDIRANIRELADAGIGILITDHNVREVFRTADRVFLITAGKVVTKGTPHQLVNDQIAIDAYLGRSFEEDGFTRSMAARASLSVSGSSDRVKPPAPARRAPVEVREERADQPAAVAVHEPPVFPVAPAPFPVDTPAPAAPLGAKVVAALEQERARRAVDALASDATAKAAVLELSQMPLAAVPALTDALERREPQLRRRAFDLLCIFAKAQGPFEFDPDGTDDVRLRQVAWIRARLRR